MYNQNATQRHPHISSISVADAYGRYVCLAQLLVVYSVCCNRMGALCVLRA